MTYSVWQSFITNGVKTISGAVVSVFHEGSGAPAALFSSPSGGAIGSSVTSDSSGLARFYVAAGVYRITVTHASFSAEHRHVRIGEMSGVDDAPSDGKQYARKDAAWEEVSASGFISSLAVTVGTGGDYATWGDCYAAVSIMQGGTLLIVGNGGIALEPSGDVVFPNWKRVSLGRIYAPYGFKLYGQGIVSVGEVRGGSSNNAKLHDVLVVGGTFGNVDVYGMRVDPAFVGTAYYTAIAGESYQVYDAVGAISLSEYNGSLVVEESSIAEIKGGANTTVRGHVFTQTLTRAITGYLPRLCFVSNGVLTVDQVTCGSGGVGNVFEIDQSIVNAPSIGGTYTAAANIPPNQIGYAGLYIGQSTVATYSKKTSTLTSSSGVVTINCADGIDKHTLTLSENVTSWSFTNRPTGTDYVKKIVAVTQNASAAKTCVSPATKTAGSAWTVSSTLSSEEWLELWIGASDVYLRASGTMV